MPSKFSNTEVRQLQRVLDDYEKWHASWRKLRWLTLLMAFLTIAASIYSVGKMQQLEEQFNYAAYGLKESPVTEFLEGHIAKVEAQMNWHFSAMLFGVVGGWLLIGSLMGWRGKGSENALVACLREIVDAELEREHDT